MKPAANNDSREMEFDTITILVNWPSEQFWLLSCNYHYPLQTVTWNPTLLVITTSHQSRPTLENNINLLRMFQALKSLLSCIKSSLQHDNNTAWGIAQRFVGGLLVKAWHHYFETLQIHLGMQHDGFFVAHPGGLPLEEVTLADRLRERGYATHLIGKWSLGFSQEEYMPTHRGFDSFFGNGHWLHYVILARPFIFLLH